MVSVDKINPLNVLASRESTEPVPYFQYVYIDLKYNVIMSVKDWIYNNLKNRFYIGESLQLENNQFKVKIKIGFEDPKEASFFLLACPLLRYTNS